MSIIRVGLAETKDFADGYDAIFGAKKAAATKAKPKTKAETKGKTIKAKVTPAVAKTTTPVKKKTAAKAPAKKNKTEN